MLDCFSWLPQSVQGANYGPSSRWHVNLHLFTIFLVMFSWNASMWAVAKMCMLFDLILNVQPIPWKLDIYSFIHSVYFLQDSQEIDWIILKFVKQKSISSFGIFIFMLSLCWVKYNVKYQFMTLWYFYCDLLTLELVNI